MSRDGEMEKLLGSGRVETTPAVDERVMERSARALRRPFWGPLAAAAALIVIALTPLFLPHQPEHQPDALYVANFSNDTISGIDSAGDRITIRFNESLNPGTVIEPGSSFNGLTSNLGLVANLDDVTNGLEDRSARGFDNRAKKLPVQGDKRVAGVYFHTKKAGDFRARTENVFDEALTKKLNGTYRQALSHIDELRNDKNELINEKYDATAEAGFRDPRHEPLSTFSIDVDTAAMANVRRFLTAGRMPPKGAVRIERGGCRRRARSASRR